MARIDTAVLRGATVLITGSARGMGELYARKAAAGGAARIALWDVNTELAEKLAAELRAPGVEVEVFAVDVSRLESIREGVAAVREKLGPVDILVNNAGIVRGVPFWQHDAERDIELTMRINTLGPMWLTREVLPDMMADTARPKRILNIASAAGTLPNPNMSVYASSKWAMIGWSESVRLELARTGHPHVKVTTFCPSYVSTGMFEGARGPLWTPIMTPDQAASAAWNGMLRGTPMVLRPWTVKLAMFMRGLLPTRWWDGAAAKVFHVYSSMDAFVGRKEG